MSVAVKSHRRVYPEKKTQVSIAEVDGVTHVEWGDVAALVPKFMVPVPALAVDAVTVAGRAFVSCRDLAAWAEAFDRKDMKPQADATRRIAEWAHEEIRGLGNGKQ